MAIKAHETRIPRGDVVIVRCNRCKRDNEIVLSEGVMYGYLEEDWIAKIEIADNIPVCKWCNAEFDEDIRQETETLGEIIHAVRRERRG